MTCKACQEREQDCEGSPPKCAFTDGAWSPNNWNCATLGKLRKMIYHKFDEGKRKFTLVFNDDHWYATVPIIFDQKQHGHLDQENLPAYLSAVCLYVGWYKNRGKTEMLMLMFENDCRPPTEEEVLAILATYSTPTEEDS